MARIVYKSDEKVLEKVEQIIHGEQKHEGYKRAVAIEQYWECVRSGKDQLSVVFDIHTKETVAEQEQRKRIYNSYTPMAYSRLQSPTKEISRCRDFVRDVKSENKDSIKDSNDAFKNYHGNLTLCQYLDQNIWDFVNVYCNSFFINLWDEDNNCSYSAIARAKDVIDYEYFNGHLQWVLIKEDKKTPSEVIGRDDNQYTKYILYSAFGVYEWVLVDNQTKDLEKFRDLEKKDIIDKNGRKKTYFYVAYPHDCSQPLAYPLGCYDDPCSDNALGIKEALIYPAKDLINELIFYTSRYQTTMVLYGFLKNWFAVPPCRHSLPENPHLVCEGGKIGGEICGVCNGTGKEKKIQTSEQQVVNYEFRLAKGADPDEVLNFEKMYGSQEIPIHVFDHMKQKIEDTLQLISLSVWNTNVLDRTEASNATATEISALYKSINNGNHIYATCSLNIWKFVRITDAKFRGIDIELQSMVPSDFKMETSQDIITHIKAAKEVGIPEYVNKWKERLISFNDNNSKELEFFKAREKFRPFYDCDQDMRQFLSSELPATDDKFVLLIFFDDIFREIKCEDEFREVGAGLNEPFECLDHKKQKLVVEFYINKYRERLNNSVVELGSGEEEKQAVEVSE